PTTVIGAAASAKRPNYPPISTRRQATIMALKPLSDRIVVQALEAEEKSPGGILLPDTAKEKPQQGKVIAVGPGKLLDNGKISPMDVKVGDVIYFAKYGGTEVKIGSEEYTILRQDDVLAVVEK